MRLDIRLKEHEVLVELTLESNNSLQFEFLFHLFVLVVCFFLFIND